eukprot:CAMPEP_0196580226 /NCGR_PEP_ID=MMETSP1081-20130531/27906_1 /TAXON_ID=36882 /ORGANISM="Pyramimonas amylifera, Strain CCMP720" /LENGTH=59 /DNA_ID=CAMNT_0041900049 /DNA_START=307 /DNA_END=486 /DNA_ORIENTATION=-
MGSTASVQREVGFLEPEPYHSHNTASDQARKEAFEAKRKDHYGGVATKSKNASRIDYDE